MNYVYSPVIVYGNQENPKGNPIPYERMTQRGKFKRRDAQRYMAWTKFVQQQWIIQTGEALPSKKREYSIKVHCAFLGETHGDPDNILKGIIDAIFKICGDKHVAAAVTFEHRTSDPFIMIQVEAR